MPILPVEPDCHPLDLWEEPESLPAKPEGIWLCLHTKPRQEKSTARDLREQGVVYYLPQVVKETRTPGGRKIRSVVPLFPGYLFLYGDANDRLAALRGNRLVNILQVADQDGLVRDLRQVNTMLHSGLAVSDTPTVPVGAKVRIQTGPLSGIVGTVIRRGNRDQFVAVVHFLGKGAMVDLEDWQVEQVHSESHSNA
jgi:transcription antitermination factor NusG